MSTVKPPISIKRRVAGLAVAALGLAGLGLFERRHRPEPVAIDPPVEDGARPAESDDVVAPSPLPAPMPEPPVHDRRMRFRDGSTAQLASAETDLKLVTVQDRRIICELVAGAARFEVTRRPSRVFRVVIGETLVEGTATTFELWREGTRLRVHVLAGRLRVAWSKGRRQLGKGDDGLFPPGRVFANGTRRSAAVPTTWIDNPRTPDADNRDAESEGDDNLAALLKLAEQARARGRFKEAATALRAAAAQDAEDPRAPLAEFRLGCLLLENLAQPRTAAAAFARARALEPDGSFASDALAREIEARAVSGERERAQMLARAYLSRDPDARYAAWVRRWGGLTR